MACIFLYVGAEVAVGSLIVNYLEQANVLAADPATAGKYIPLYWGGALIGRSCRSAALRVFSPGKLLAAAGAITLILISANSTGAISAYALLAIGLTNSIMFILFGATADLAQRMPFPSLHGLHSDGLLPEALRIVSTARSDMDDARYRDGPAANAHRVDHRDTAGSDIVAVAYAAAGLPVYGKSQFSAALPDRAI